MLEGLMGEISSTIKGILAKLNLCDTKLDEIGAKQDSTSTALTTVGTKIDGVQTTSDTIKTMISSEVKTAITNAKKEIIAAMPSGGSACVKSVQSGDISYYRGFGGKMSILYRYFIRNTSYTFKMSGYTLWLRKKNQRLS